MKTKFRGKKEALEYAKKHRISKDKFVTVHGRRMKIRTLSKEPEKKDWTKNLKLRSGDLKALGYSTKLPPTLRHESLVKAIKKYGYDSVMHKLNAVSNMSVNKQGLHRIYRSDIKWLER